MKFITLMLVFFLCPLILSGCASVAFPDPVAKEMEEDPNPQTNNFL